MVCELLKGRNCSIAQLRVVPPRHRRVDCSSRGSVNAPDLRFIQRSQLSFLGIAVVDVMILPVNCANRAVMQRYENAVAFEVLREGKTLAVTLTIVVERRHERRAAHPIWFWLACELQNCRGE